MNEMPVPPQSNAAFLVDLGDRRDPQAAEAGFAQVIFPRFEVHEGVSEPRLILRRGVTGARDLYRWWDLARRDKAPRRRSVRITLLAGDGQSAVLRWRFVNAKPVALEYGALDANAPAVLLESIELVYERMEIEA